ncbi:DsbE family thiol:disulfide interchange protein [uncultured Azonexus sp.]|uniref:DsbE family thiol:disulfide interchange protein n=1 Tax=uncultured Azonexus sp. TaxID=520307 RepID=UPI0026078966|nr:DsbE family thiol:disulfide interchange protein [uncultured Azonexus sp.]
MNRYFWVLGAFIALVVLLAVGLSLNPREVPSPLVGKPAPAFRLAVLGQDGQTMGPEDLKGKVWLLNVWASWCVSCRQEHPVLVDFARRGNGTPIVGLNYKELRGDGAIDMRRVPAEQEVPLALERASGWLKTHGDPYLLTVMDIDGRVGIDYGVYGVPETYVIDKTGIIRMKHTGPVSPQILNDKILPLVAELNK